MYAYMYICIFRFEKIFVHISIYNSSTLGIANRGASPQSQQCEPIVLDLVSYCQPQSRAWQALLTVESAASAQMAIYSRGHGIEPEK